MNDPLLANSLMAWLVNLIFPGVMIEEFLQSDPMITFIMLFGSLVLVLMTVSFLFKFILKLVDR